MLMKPLVGVLLSAFFLEQPISWNILAGGILILLGNYVVIRNPKEN